MADESATKQSTSWRSAWSVILLRFLGIVLIAQISGVAHFVADVFFDDDLTCADEHRGQPDDDVCPPGSAACHLGAHVEPVDPAGARAVLVPAAPASGELPADATARSPLLRPAGRLDRPPRT